VAACDDTLRFPPLTISQRDGARLPGERPTRLPGSGNPGIGASATRHSTVLVSAYATEVLTAVPSGQVPL
jgi:hypothetical protein